MQVDESEEQTKRIINHVLDKYSSINHGSKWEDNLQKLYEISQIYKQISKQFKGIYIPFGDKIRDMIPSINLTMRRDLPKILNLTCVIAFLNFAKRKKIPFDGGQYFYDNLEAHKMSSYYLIAEPEDFKQALKIGGETIQQTLNKINSSSMEIYKIFMSLFNEDPLGGITVSEVAKKANKSQNRTGELLKQLFDMGFLSRNKEGKEFRYFPTEKKFENIQAEDIEFTEEELDLWLDSQNLVTNI